MSIHDLPVSTEQADRTAVHSINSGADALINRIDPADLRLLGDLIGRRSDPVSGYIDIPNLDQLRPTIVGMGTVGMRPWGGIDREPIISFGDRNPYPLPDDPLAGGVRPVDNPNAGAQEALMKRIQEQAIKNVQANMTPEEKHRLNEDWRRYREDLAQVPTVSPMGTGGGFFHPKFPQVPESVQRYNAKIEAEKDRIAAGMHT